MNTVTIDRASDMGVGSHDDADDFASAHRSWITVGAIVVMLILIGLLTADRLFNPDKFQIRDIEIRGHLVNVDSEQVRNELVSELNGNYFSISLHRLEQKITRLPWVFSASLRRQWPSTIVVDVVEIQPVAVWGRNQWLNSTGDLVERQSGGGLNSADDMPRLHGPRSGIDKVWISFQRWSEKFASIGLSLDELVLDERDLWKLTLSLGALAIDDSLAGLSGDSGNWEQRQVTMIVERQGAAEKIERFIAALNQELIVKFPMMDAIDLRYPNGFAISWIPTQEPESLSAHMVTGQVTSIE